MPLDRRVRSAPIFERVPAGRGGALGTTTTADALTCGSTYAEGHDSWIHSLVRATGHLSPATGHDVASAYQGVTTVTNGAGQLVLATANGSTAGAPAARTTRAAIVNVHPVSDRSSTSNTGASTAATASGSGGSHDPSRAATR